MNKEIIQIKGLSKKIDRKYLLTNVNITINQGELVVLLGSNGSGKSTLIKCLTGLYKIDEGEIYIDGIKWTKKNVKKIKQMISYIPDKVNFDLNLTIEQNLLHHAALYGISANSAMDKLNQLFEFFNLSDRRHESINKLSYGMQKKALIIRGLLSSPSILIFDEPTLGLDPKVKQDLMKEIFKLHTMGITVVLSTQSLQVANQSDKVIYIENGNVYDLQTVNRNLDLSKESLHVSVAGISEEEEEIIKDILSKQESVFYVIINQLNIEIVIENKADAITKALGILLEMNLIIYSIEFGNVSYMSLYEKNVSDSSI